MKIRVIALSGAALLSLTLAAAAQESGGATSGGATSGGATSSAPAAPPQPPTQESYTPPPPPPAPLALSGGWYLGFGAGWDSPNDLKFEDSLGNIGTLKRSDSALLAGSIGYRFPSTPFRLEVEGGYTWHDIRQVDISAGPLAGSSASASGHSNLGHVLVNAIYDIPLGERWALSLGAGAGGGFSDVTANIGGVSGSASKSGFMWQGIGGVMYRVMPNVDLFADYRYRDAMTSGNLNLNNGDIVHFHNTTENAVLVGFRWYLWSPTY